MWSVEITTRSSTMTNRNSLLLRSCPYVALKKILGGCLAFYLANGSTAVPRPTVAQRVAYPLSGSTGIECVKSTWPIRATTPPPRYCLQPHPLPHAARRHPPWRGASLPELQRKSRHSASLAHAVHASEGEPRKQPALLDSMLEIIAADPVPYLPYRNEPRAKKAASKKLSSPDKTPP